MSDLRTIAPVKTTDKITGKKCFKVPVNIIEISNKPKAYRIYKNSVGTGCRDIKVELCGTDGRLITVDAIMWETTFKNNFKDHNNNLPYTTMAKVIENELGYGGINIIVYTLDLVSFLLKPLNNSFERTQEFVNNYEEFFSWLNEIKQQETE